MRSMSVECMPTSSRPCRTAPEGTAFRDGPRPNASGIRRGEGRFAHRSLQASYALAERIRPYAPRLVSRPRLRRVIYGQMFAHPESMTPGEALAHLDML